MNVERPVPRRPSFVLLYRCRQRRIPRLADDSDDQAHQA
jgi:hypothetical protein